jgi:hypothetical protein
MLPKRASLCCRIMTLALAFCGTISAGILSGGSSVLFSATEGIFQSAPVAQFHDSDPNEPASNLLALINWGDGTMSAGAIAGGGGVFNVLGSHTYAEEGNYNVAVQASNTSGAQVLINGLGTVNDAPLVNGSSAPLQGTEGLALNGTLGSFTDTNPFGLASDFGATINWGDGTLSLGTIVSNAGQFQVLGSHVYDEEGAYTTSLNVADVGGSTTLVHGSTFILDATLLPGPFLMPALNQGAAFNGIVNAFLDTDPNGLASDYTAVIDWGDGSAVSVGTILAGGGGMFDVEGQHTYAGSGQFQVHINVLDLGGSTVAIAGTETVNAVSTNSPEPASVLLIGAGLALLAAYASTSFTTSPCTSVRRKWRPWNL